MILTIRTTIGRENVVMSEIEERVRSKGYKVRALLHPEKLRGYVIIEGEEDDIKLAVSGLRHVNGLIQKPVTLEQIKHFIEEKKGAAIELVRGDIVEIVGGPFKHEKGKITKVDESKNEVTVELLEAAVPIPVTITADSVRLLEKSKDVIQQSQEGAQKKEEE
ncbi:MAG: transcription elongation factor Spt5 [Candidatus Aenigmatarchaeota archaeon]|nr:MAG: transcription elongation factor Spt5 [Candidatus Aenigmarchaeota archaeon]